MARMVAPGVRAATIAWVRIGPLRIDNPLVLAPMEEHTSLPFRLLCRRFGAGLVYAERLDAEDVAERDKRALKLLATDPAERPCAAQISTCDPAAAGAAAVVCAERGFALIDLNCECPVKRVLAKGAGGALMAEPDRIGRLVAAMVPAGLPVTVKLRSGPDDTTDTAIACAQAAVAAGASALMVHPRSVITGYAGPARPEVCTQVAAAVPVPVIAGGGVRTAEDAVHLLRTSGCAAVAIARGCLGRPWIFARARALAAGAPPPPEPSAEMQGRCLIELAEGEWRHYGPGLALRRLPRVACYFAKDRSDFSEFRAAVQQVRDLDGLRRLVRATFR
jgi:nifR3 family TIM-barrel protein